MHGVVRQRARLGLRKVGHQRVGHVEHVHHVARPAVPGLEPLAHAHIVLPQDGVPHGPMAWVDDGVEALVRGDPPHAARGRVRGCEGAHLAVAAQVAPVCRRIVLAADAFVPLCRRRSDSALIRGESRAGAAV